VTAIDEWLPQYQVGSCHSVLVRASVEKTYAALKHAEFSNLSIVRGLMRLRGYRIAGSASPESAPAGVTGAFLELVTVPQEEVLLGIAGRFWRPDGGIVRGLTPAEFADFHREGYAKAVWNFSLAPSDGGTKLRTETRVQTFSRSATVKFRMYWIFVGPFSGMIRNAMLNQVKRLAEQSAA
jgi:hypothetical protein